MHGRAWWGVCGRRVCMAGGVHGKGGLCVLGGMCGTGGHVWQGGMVAGGIPGRGVCVAGGHAVHDMVNELAVSILLECILIAIQLATT